MASRAMKIIVQVQDGASRKLGGVEKQIRKTGRAVDDTSKRFMKFNRTLFTTTAFIGIFVKAFQGIGRSLTAGANFGLVERQFERTMGPKGNLIRQIKGMTDVAIDRMDAMRAGIQLSNLGVVKSSTQVARIVSVAGVAARMSAMDTSEGIQRVTRFLKTANVQELEALNIIRSGDPALKARLGVIGATAKTMSGAVRSMYLYREGMRLLDRATRGAMFGQRSLADTLKDFKETFANLGGQFGKFLGKALGPMIDKFTDLGDTLADVIEKLTLNKRFIEISKSVIVATVATTGLVGALGALKLVTMALGSIGFGIPKLIFLLMSGALAFKTLTAGATDVVERLRVFKTFIQGVWQLITGFDKETGISRLDKDLQEMLRKNGLLGLAKNVARVATVVRYFVTDVGQTLIDWGKTAFAWMSKLATPFKDLLGIDGEAWSRGWIDGLGGIRGALVKLTAGFLVFKGLKSLAGGLLSRVPVIGGLFGGGKGPKGTATDPIWTTSIGMAGGLIGKIPGVKLLGDKFQKLILKSTLLGEIFTHPGGKLKGMLALLGKGFLTIGKGALGLVSKFGLTALALTAAAGAGFALGKMLLHLFPTLGKLGDWAYELIHGEDEKQALSKATSDEAILNKINQNRKRDGLDQINMEEFLAGGAKRTTSSADPLKTGKRSQVSTPYVVKDEMAKIDEIGSEISGIKDKEHRD